MARHHLVLVDRGLGHVHRWRATCRCGWIAPNRRRKRVAKRLYREHIEGMVTAARRSHLRPRPPTPPARLPEALR